MDIALIGCGYWGSNLARNLDALGVLKYVVDINEKNGECLANKYSVEFINNYKNSKLLGIDGVVIAVPPTEHYIVAKYFLDNGINCFIEKPMTLSPGDAWRLKDIADDSNLVLMVGHVFLYSNEIQFIKNYIDSGKLGKIYSITARRLNLGKLQNGCNVVWDLAPHDIAVFNYLLNQPGPTKIDGTINSFLGNTNEEEALLSLTYKYNVVCNLHMSWLYPRKIRDMVIVGSDAMLEYDMLGENKVSIYDKGVDLKEVDTLASANYGSHLLSYRYGDVVSPYIKVEEPLRKELKDFIDCINSGNTPISNSQIGCEVVEVLSRIDFLSGVR